MKWNKMVKARRYYNFCYFLMKTLNSSNKAEELRRVYDIKYAYFVRFDGRRCSMELAQSILSAWIEKKKVERLNWGGSWAVDEYARARSEALEKIIRERCSSIGIPVEEERYCGPKRSHWVPASFNSWDGKDGYIEKSGGNQVVTFEWFEELRQKTWRLDHENGLVGSVEDLLKKVDFESMIRSQHQRL